MENYKNLPFEYLYNSLNNQTSLNATGHDHHTFNILLKKTEPYYMYYKFDTDSGNIQKKVCYLDGKPYSKKRDISAVGCLGLVLMLYDYIAKLETAEKLMSFCEAISYISILYRLQYGG